MEAPLFSFRVPLRRQLHPGGRGHRRAGRVECSDEHSGLHRPVPGARGLQVLDHHQGGRGQQVPAEGLEGRAREEGGVHLRVPSQRLL